MISYRRYQLRDRESPRRVRGVRGESSFLSFDMYGDWERLLCDCMNPFILIKIALHSNFDRTEIIELNNRFILIIILIEEFMYLCLLINSHVAYFLLIITVFND